MIVTHRKAGAGN